MKVLHIGKYFPPHTGGMETYLRDVVHALGRLGIDNLALVHRSELSLRSRRERLPSGRRNVLITRAGVWARFFFMPLSPAFPFLLQRLVRKERPDLLHLHLPNASAFWALVVPAARRLPWTIHWHADVPVSEHQWFLRLFYRFYRPFERALLARARCVVVTSPPYLDSSEPLRDFHDKCVVIPLGLDPANLGALAHPPPPPSRQGLRVLAIGRLTYYKGFEYLLRAAAERPEVHIDLVGSGELAQSLQGLADKLGLGSRINFHGYLDNASIRELMLASDCLCLPSIERSEAFGLVLLEAMYFGRATVSSRLAGSGMAWVVQDGVTGALSEPGDSASLAASLEQLAGDRAKLAQLGESGRRRFDAMFHIDRSAAALADTFARALSR